MKPRGFTVVEMLVVMLVLGVLAAMSMPMAEIALQRDKERELKRALWDIRDAIDAYRQAVDNGVLPAAAGVAPYPSTLQSLVDGVPSRNGVLRLLRSVPRDPFADPTLPPEQTWALRSYESDSGSSQAGADVYDVHSRSTLAGLNGVPLNQW